MVRIVRCVERSLCPAWPWSLRSRASPRRTRSRPRPSTPAVSARGCDQALRERTRHRLGAGRPSEGGARPQAHPGHPLLSPRAGWYRRAERRWLERHGQPAHPDDLQPAASHNELLEESRTGPARRSDDRPEQPGRSIFVEIKGTEPKDCRALPAWRCDAQRSTAHVCGLSWASRARPSQPAAHRRRRHASDGGRGRSGRRRVPGGRGVRGRIRRRS